LVTNNFPDETVTLDTSGSGSGVTMATLKTDISQILPSPALPLAAPVRRIHVDCIWQFQGAETITNSIETCRAPN